MTVDPGIGDAGDQFPIGMRVLVVDDDVTCLSLLETLLRRCKYHVTTTREAMTALTMLRENKNKFDLVICDVHMPYMDGFQLLDLLEHEMDLPVILLSANDDSKLVMKGITHGACYYLVKPVRIEELKNIWQHVVRRKKLDSTIRNISENQDKPQISGGEGGPGISGNSDQNGKSSRKRKDRDEDEGEERDQTELDSTDTSTQKKPRFVWSVEMHHKFVEAVNQLGLEKAVPRKILDLMNVATLTRGIVASHLQKYRLYLKRMGSLANLPANMAATLNGMDSPNLQRGSLNGLGSFHTLAGSDHLKSTAFEYSPPSGICGRLKTPARLERHHLTSSRNIQLGHAPNSRSITNDEGEFQPIMPMPLELGQLQNSKGVTCIGVHSTAINNKSGYPVSSGFTEAKVTSDSPGGIPLSGAINNPPLSEGYPQEGHSGRNFGNQSSFIEPLIISEFSSQLLDGHRCDDDRSTSILLSRVQLNSFPVHDCLGKATLPSSTLSETTTSTMDLQFGCYPCGLSSITPMPTQLEDSIADLQFHAALVSDNRGSNIYNARRQEWNDHKLDAPYQSNVDDVLGSLDQRLNPNDKCFHEDNKDFNLIGQLIDIDEFFMKNNEVEKSDMGSSLTLNEGYLGLWKPQGSYFSSNSLEDLFGEIMGQEPYNDKQWKELGFNDYF